MKFNDWVAEIMSIKIHNARYRDFSKLLLIFYLADNQKINSLVKYTDYNIFLYRFYSDNPVVSSCNPNTIIRNINKFNLKDTYEITKNTVSQNAASYKWSCINVFRDGFSVELEDFDEKYYKDIKMISNMIYKQATWNDYNYVEDIPNFYDINEYDIEKINETIIINRVFEKINYCVCCDSDEDLKVINISNDMKYLHNPENYVTVCKKHYDLFMNWFYVFGENGKITILKDSPELNKNMHISNSLLKIFR